MFLISVAESDQACDSPTELPRSSSDLSGSAQECTPRRLRCSASKTSSPLKECGKFLTH